MWFEVGFESETELVQKHCAGKCEERRIQRTTNGGSGLLTFAVTSYVEACCLRCPCVFHVKKEDDRAPRIKDGF